MLELQAEHLGTAEEEDGMGMTHITATDVLSPEVKVMAEVEVRKQRASKVRVPREYRIWRTGQPVESVVLVRYHDRLGMPMSALLAVEGQGTETTFRGLQMCSRGNEKHMIDKLYEQEGARRE